MTLNEAVCKWMDSTKLPDAGCDAGTSRKRASSGRRFDLTGKSGAKRCESQKEDCASLYQSIETDSGE